ncbi:sensor histidine kinase [Anaerosacchariphilus polymeriproducens]|uniref:histidine kinase n=1 Tax=Anaerosacchariphilus polymeriproducens TaxID=1812858 RepID=A0A371ARX9_9FIRM|nr:sensor histidine kinase [Anaerosacchariphilus polymeriproducens]RDU22240.1 sensor histidine kinase [Anaerosacchariphilus polymeriproducens]
MQNKKLEFIRLLMIVINFVIVLVLAIIIYITTGKICESFQAEEFINRIHAVPLKREWIFCISAGGYLIWAISFWVRERLKKKCNSSFIPFYFFLFDVVFAIIIMRVLNMSYNGIMLLVIANVIMNLREQKGMLWALIIAVIIFVLADYDFLSIRYRMCSINDYIRYYDSSVQMYLLGLKNIIISINIIIFIIFIIFLMLEQLEENNKVKELYQEITKANTELKIANVQLKDYAIQTEKLGETRERNRLAREIHDTLGHALTGISAGLDACVEMIEEDPLMAKNQLSVIGEVARQGIKDVRRSVNELRADALERYSLQNAIQKLIEDITSVSHLQIFYESTIENLKFSADEEETIYRVVQEGITNAIRHGKATVIRIQISKKNEMLELIIKDNGRGCKKIKPGFGTRHIQERVEMLRGSTNYDGTDGFKISVNIPIRWGENYD